MSKDVEQDLIRRLYEGKKSFEQIAAYVLRDREIACLEARQEEEMVYGGSKRHQRIAELSGQIADLRGRKDDDRRTET